MAVSGTDKPRVKRCEVCSATIHPKYRRCYACFIGRKKATRPGGTCDACGERVRGGWALCDACFRAVKEVARVARVSEQLAAERALREREKNLPPPNPLAFRKR